MHINISSSDQSYDIIHERGSLNRAGELLDLNRKICVVTDDGVPEDYVKTLVSQCKEAVTFVMPHGEGSKNSDNFLGILKLMLDNGFTRNDAVVACGGGVCGDIGAFAASCYMRGVTFYNIPTTVLSMVDSSIGGKTAVDFNGVKNAIGTFYQPGAVLIDTDTLKTLDPRQISAGMAEVIKMAATFDTDLFEMIEKSTDLEKDIDTFVLRANEIKKRVVEEDPKEKGLRRALNFGHTIGHAIESFHEGALLHGECVALGMIPMSSEEVKERLIPVLKKYDLPVNITDNMDDLTGIMSHDKKAMNGKIRTVICEKIGSFIFKDMTLEEIKRLS